jgi:hypothetical protein
MITALVLGHLMTRPVESVTDYFPLTTGLKRRYQVVQDKEKSEYTDEVRGLGVFGDREATKVTAFVGGVRASQAFYAVEENSVLLVANLPDSPLKPPRAVFKLPAGSEPLEWSWIGIEDGLKIEFNAVAKRIKPGKVLGEERPMVEITMNVDLDPGEFVTKVKQVSKFALGVGLVEMVEETKTRRTSTKRTTKLVAIEARGGQN